MFLVLATVSVSCSNDDDATRRNVVTMPVHLVIPATDVTEETRAGDPPGETEVFKLPKYAYVYIVCQDIETQSNVVVHTMFNLDEKQWRKTQINNNDSVYQYNGSIHVYLPINRGPVGNVYAALSTVELPGLPRTDTGENISESETDVQNYKYKINDNVNAELANIYSTPYNYTIGNTYYATIDSLNSLTPHLDLVLYHVAARLDLQWNVDESIQSSTAIQSIALSLPSADSCYIFKPLETESTKTRQETITTDVGNQWYGRQYIYVIPMRDASGQYAFDATVTLTNNTTREASIKTGVINTNQPFTPWMRGFITVGN